MVGKKVWFATDEWTDTQGHAIINVLLGCNADIFVVATLQLECKGPNLGVENSEVGAAIVDTIGKMGVQLADVIAFVTDSASVLKKAFEDHLRPLCPNAQWVPCTSHSLNNVAKSILSGLDVQLTQIFERGVTFDVSFGCAYFLPSRPLNPACKEVCGKAKEMVCFPTC